MRLSSIEVRGLFGNFNHRVPLNLDERITIIHGPNGFGKTVMLTILDAFFNSTGASISKYPFDQIQICFDTGSNVCIQKEFRNSTKRKSTVKIPTVKYVFTDSNGKIHTHEPFSLLEEEHGIPIHIIDDIIGELDRVGPRKWMHLPTGDTLNLEEVVDKYGDILEDVFNDLPHFKRIKEPDWLVEIKDFIPARFINTERLHVVGRREQHRYQAHDVRERPIQERAVKRYSDELRETIRRTLTDYGTLSQSLDRTFPARVVTVDSHKHISLEELKNELSLIEKKRESLIDAGLLPAGEQETLQMPILEEVDESKREILAVFASDAQNKLGVFDEIFKKISLFQNILNDRLLHKDVIIGPEGFEVIASNGEKVDKLDLHLLSSGEQHEIVLMYELLFNVKKDSLILIDEPEISLHIAWQEEFVNDLDKMANLSEFTAILATHSPQIISDRWDLAVELKGPKT